MGDLQRVCQLQQAQPERNQVLRRHSGVSDAIWKLALDTVVWLNI